MTDPASTPTPAPAPAPAASPAPAPSPTPTPAPAANWFDTLPEDLRANETLTRYPSIEELARGHVETKKLATSRVPTPGDTPESFKAFADAIRPADPSVYEINVPEGMSSEFADNFRAAAHEIGLPAPFAKGLSDWYNEFTAKALEAENQKSQQDVLEFKTSFGPQFDAKLQAVQAWLPQMGVELSEEDMAALDSKIGSKNLLNFIFQMHDRIGELPHAGADGGQQQNFGATTPAQADQKLSDLQNDPAWRSKAKTEGSPEHREYQRLTRLIAQGRSQAQRTPPKAA